MRYLVALWFINFFTTDALVLPNSTANLNIRDEASSMQLGEPARDRTIFTILSLIYMMVLSLLLGSRFGKLRRSLCMKRNSTSMLVLILHILLFMFIITSAVLVAGQGLYNRALCRAGTWVCLIFYTFTKAIIYIFLVERIHVVRAPFVNRKQDKIYIACMSMVIIMYGSAIINGYINNVTEMYPDGRCHFGVRGSVSIPFTVINFFTDIVLTVVFFYLLRPFVKLHGILNTTGALKTRVEGGSAIPHHVRDRTAVQRSIKILLWKSIVGSFLIEIPMAANMISLVVTDGAELGMLCLTFCMSDVFWDALVIHWLTFGSSAIAAQENLVRSSEPLSAMELTRSQSAPQFNDNGRHNTRRPSQPTCERPKTALIRMDLLRGLRKDSAADMITVAPPKRYDGGV